MPKTRMISGLTLALYQCLHNSVGALKLIAVLVVSKTKYDILKFSFMLILHALKQSRQ